MPALIGEHEAALPGVLGEFAIRSLAGLLAHRFGFIPPDEFARMLREGSKPPTSS
mgnify:CR=1 FL=1